MKFNRLTCIAACVTVFASTCIAFKEPDEDEPPRTGFFPVLHHNHPRIFSIFSKPPAEKDAPKQTGPSIIGHLGNVLQGGTIGIALSGGPLGTILDHAKKIIPGGHGTVGQPHYEKPGKPDWEMKKEPVKLPPEPEEEPEPDYEPEPEKKPVKKPDRGGYDWDDIGEEPSTEVPIEQIINPRLRPKRFIDSKIYHVPLAFRSNGKPYKVVEKTQNSLGPREKM